MKHWPLALLFTLCAMAARAGEPAPYAAIHTVGIVSTLGDGLLVKQDYDLFGEAAPDLVVHTGLDLDGYIVAQVRHAAASRFTVVEPAADPAVLKDYDIPAQLQDDLRSRAARSPASIPDALIIIHPTEYEIRGAPPFILMRYRYVGLSLTHTKGLLAGSSNLLSAQYVISVVDTRTGKQIGWADARLPAMGIFNRRPAPLLICRKDFWAQIAPQLPQLSPENQHQLQADVMAIVAMSLPNALQGVGLAAAGNDSWMSDWQGQPLMCEHL